MNRRQIAQAILTGTAVPLFGLGMLPDVMADTRPAAHGPHQATADDIFHAVVVFDVVAEDFIVRGVYTLDSDAQAHLERLPLIAGQYGLIRQQAWNIRVNRDWLREQFIGERLGSLKDVLERLEARLMIDAHG